MDTAALNVSTERIITKDCGSRLQGDIVGDKRFLFLFSLTRRDNNACVVVVSMVV